ncbi:secreted RxLR effector protein 161-like [Primulina tabacum]|uniref:secreted RxLR effector protein 161-like n=1 Tax=Primulina tabacum TaxID=48773 RepID=UPI003F5A727E
MDKAHPLASSMFVRSLDGNKDPFRPPENGEKIVGPEVPYLSVIGALSYLANCNLPDISFSVNLLARYNSCRTRRHWNGVKHIFRYFRGTTDMRLFYSTKSKSSLVGYADARYLSDPHKAKSLTGYVFTRGDAAISWKSVKQSLTVTSSNHSEIIAMHETSRECLKGGYVKGDRTKNISPKFFYTHELQENGDIDVHQIRSSDNVADLFTKALSTSTFKKLVHKIGMHQLKDLR